MTQISPNQAAIDKIVASAIANLGTGKAPPSVAETPTPTISAEEARAIAEDEAVARITGDPTIVTRGAEDRRLQREKDEKAAARTAHEAREMTQAAAIAARIVEA